MTIHRFSHEVIEHGGNRYEGKLVGLPRYSVELPEFFAGIEQPDNSNFVLSDKDNLITELKRTVRLRNKKVTIKEVLEDELGNQEEFLDYVGVITSSPVRMTANISLRNKDYDALNNLWPKWKLNTTDFPDSPEEEQGRPIPFVAGFARKIPAFLIEGTESISGNLYRYLIGYGNLTIENVYRDNLVLREYTGTVSSVTSTTCVLDAGQADKGEDFFNDLYITVNGQTRKVTDYVASTRRITVESSWSITSGQSYVIRQWKKNTLSVGGDTFTEIQFSIAQRLSGERVTSSRMRVDVQGLQTERNPAEWLRTVMGLMDIPVNDSAFDDVSAELGGLGLVVDGACVDQRTLFQWFNQVCLIGRIILRTNEAGEIYPVLIKVPETVHGTYDAEKNIHQVLAPEEEAYDSLWKTVAVQYRYFHDSGEFRLESTPRTIHADGVQTEVLPFDLINDKTTADRLCNYLAEAKKARDYVQPILVGHEARGRENLDLINFKDPIGDVDGDYMIIGRGREGVPYSLRIIPKPSGLTVYVPEALPSDSVSDDTADFRDTPPPAVTSAAVAWEVLSLNVASRGRLTWVNPSENFNRVRIEFKKSTDSIYSFLAETSGTLQETPPLVAGQQYNFRWTSINDYGVEGGVVVVTSTSSGDSQAPATPGQPTGDRHGRVFVWTVAEAPEDDIDEYIWEIRTSSNTLIKTLPKQGTEITWTVSGTSSQTLKARVKLKDYSGNESAFGAYSANLTTETYATGHVTDGAITNPKIGNSAVDSLKLASLAVARAHIQLLAVDTAQIDNLAVTTLKVTNGAIDEDKRINVYNSNQGVTLGNVDPNRVIKGTIVVNHGLGLKPMVSLRFSAPSVDASDRLHRTITLVSVGTTSFTIHWEVGNHGGLGTLDAGTATIEWWYW